MTNILNHTYPNSKHHTPELPDVSLPDDPPTPDEQPGTLIERKVTGIRWSIAVVAIISSTFLYALDNTIMANIRPNIIDTFGHMEMLPWISVSYPMGEVGTCPFWGAMYSQFNNKWLYMFTLMLFEAGSAMIGSARSIEIFVVGRVIAGIGGSGIYVGTVNILSAMTTNVEQAQCLGFVGVAWSLGTILGPIVGGAFGDSKATWRWAFYINICVAAAAAPACLWLIPSFSPDAKTWWGTRLKRLDLIGAFLFTGGMSSAIMILSFGGVLWDWDDGRMVVLYVDAPLLWAIFCVQQWRELFTTHRVLPIELLDDWQMCNSFCQTAISISNIVVTIWTVPLFLQFVLGDSSLRSGLYVFAISSAAIAAAGAVFMLTGNALLATTSSSTSRAEVCGYASLQLFGCGLVVQLPFTIAQVKVQPRAVRSVTALLTTAQMTGVALSIGIVTSIFTNSAAAEIAKLLPNSPRDEVYAGLAGVAGVGISFVEGLPADLQDQVLNIVAREIGQIFYLSVASSAFGLVLSLMMRRERLEL